jgi:sugar/nucleoside kinase (ribokinase family)
MAAFVCGGSALLNVKPAVSGATCCCRSDTFAVASIGNLATDITIECEQLPAHTGDHQRVSHANIDLGGSLNVLIAASRLGAACAPVGFVSDDGGPGGGGGGGFGSFLMQAVARFGFSSTDGVIPRSGFTSPQCTVLVERGRGSTFLATNEKALPTAEGGDLIALPGAMLDVLRRSQSLVIDGACLASQDWTDVSRTPSAGAPLTASAAVVVCCLLICRVRCRG